MAWRGRGARGRIFRLVIAGEVRNLIASPRRCITHAGQEK